MILVVDVLQQICENFRKFKHVELVENVLSTYSIDFLHNLNHLCYWKNKNKDFKNTNWLIGRNR